MEDMELAADEHHKRKSACLHKRKVHVKRTSSPARGTSILLESMTSSIGGDLDMSERLLVALQALQVDHTVVPPSV